MIARIKIKKRNNCMLYAYISPAHVGAAWLHVPVVEDPSPPHVKAALSDKPNPLRHVNVQTLS